MQSFIDVIHNRFDRTITQILPDRPIEGRDMEHIHLFFVFITARIFKKIPRIGGKKYRDTHALPDVKFSLT